MDAARVLAAINGRMLRAYSRRTVAAVRAALPLRMALPQLERTLALNVEKEVRKDTLVICRAAEVLDAGRTPARDDLQQLYEASKQLDRDFLESSGGFPVGIVIRYDAIAPVRLARIERLLAAAWRILQAWRREGAARAALRASFGRTELEGLLRELLSLYAEETRLLSHSVRLPKLLVPAREKIARKLLDTMQQVAAGLAADLASLVHRGT